MKFFYLFILFILSGFSIQAQRSSSNFLITGKVVDSESKQVMEYCSVSAYELESNQLVNGTITDLDGNFILKITKPGQFILKVSYIGFETKTITDISLNPKNRELDLESILLNPNSKNLKEVEVTGIKNTIRYEMDKKVLDVSKNIAASNGTAVDVLESTPSVQVGVDGTVTLRGNSNFMVLVDGKPTSLTGSEALQQIPAANIKNIEIITNPSAKYEAGNAAGIINILLKEEKKIGTSGLIGISFGTFNNYNGNVNIKHNVKKLSFEFSARIRNYAGPRKVTDSLYTSNSDEIYTLTEGETTWTFGGYNFNYGMGYKVNKNHNINLDMVYGKWYMLVDDESNLFRNNLTKGETEEVKTINDTYRGAPYFGPSLSYSGSFKNESSLSAYVGYSQSDFSEEVLNNNYKNLLDLSGGTSTAEKATNVTINSKLDYTLPIKTGKLEIGGSSRNVKSFTTSRAYDLDISDFSYTEKDYATPETDFQRGVYGIYANYSNKYKKFTYALGLRAEYTDRYLKLGNETNSYKYYKWNYVPTASFGFNFSETHQVYANYSTRIQRPMGWQIEPQIIKTSVNTYFSGNKNLRISEINSIDIGWAKSFKKKSIRLSFEFFYDLYQDHIEFISTSYKNGSTLSRPENAGRINNMGLEGNFSIALWKWWNVDLSATGFYSIYDIEFDSFTKRRTSIEGNIRLNNYFVVSKTTKLQFTTTYNSFQTTALGYRNGNIRFGLGLKQSFLENALNLSINARNIFNTDRDSGEDRYDNYYLNHSEKPAWPIVTVGLSYKINNYRRSRRQNESSQGQL